MNCYPDREMSVISTYLNDNAQTHLRTGPNRVLSTGQEKVRPEEKVIHGC